MPSDWSFGQGCPGAVVFLLLPFLVRGQTDPSSWTIYPTSTRANDWVQSITSLTSNQAENSPWIYQLVPKGRSLLQSQVLMYIC